MSEAVRAELEALREDMERIREAWDEIRGVARGCIEGDPYGNEAASLILRTMDSMVPEWSEPAQKPEPEPKPEPKPVPKPEPASNTLPELPPPPVTHWSMEWRAYGNTHQCRGTLTHLATGIRDTSGWWLDSGDAHAEAEQGLRNKLAAIGKK